MADTLNQTLIYNNQVEILSTANRTSKVFQVGELVYDSQEQALYIGDLAQTPGGILLTNSDNLAVNKLDKGGDTMAGQLNMNSNAILNVPDPNDPKDAANKRYIDTAVNNLKFGLNLSLNDLNDVDPGLTPSDGDVIVYDGNTNKFIVRPQNDVDNQSLSWDASTNGLTISQSNTVTIDSFTGTTTFQVANFGIISASQAYIDELVVLNPFSTIATDVKGDVYANDSTLIIDADTPTVNLDGTVRGNIVPDQDIAYDLGSATNRFRDLYLSGSTIDLGGTTLSIVGGNLQIGGTDIKDVVTAAGVDYSEIQNTPDLSNYVQQGDRLDGDLEGSVFADDSTLLVDGVNGKLTGLYESGDIKIDGENGWIEFKGPISFYGYNPDNIADYNGESLLFRGGLGDGAGNNAGSIAIEGGVGNDGATGGNVRLSPGGTVGGDLGKLYITNLENTASGTHLLMHDSTSNEVSRYPADWAAIVGTQIQTNGLPNNTRFSQGAPSTSNGQSGDTAGSVTFDSDYIYYCTADYTDGVADIWKRVAWSGDTW